MPQVPLKLIFKRRVLQENPVPTAPCQKLTKHWSVFSDAQYEWLAGAITNSLIVKKDHRLSVTTGVLYAWQCHHLGTILNATSLPRCRAWPPVVVNSGIVTDSLPPRHSTVCGSK